MSQRDEIERIYKDKGLDALWGWAQGHPDRWKALKEWAEAEAKRLGDELDRDRDRRERNEDKIHTLADQVTEVRKNKAENDKRLAEAQKAEDKKRIAELESRATEIQDTIDKLRAKIESKDTIAAKADLEVQKDKREKKAWIERKIVYREKWEKAKKRHQDKGGGYDDAEWEDWMGSGLDANVSPIVKKIVAWGILEYDLVATSLRRNFVPPGGSTTSFHLTGHAGDIAGARMAEFQQAVYNLFRGNTALWELFGPTNNLCLKYGNPLTLAEGDPLENLHDTHVHVAG